MVKGIKKYIYQEFNFILSLFIIINKNTKSDNTKNNKKEYI